MIKIFSKYFSILLTIVLLHSNFSMAITYMSCKMGMQDNVCLCEDNPGMKYEKITEEESACCKVKTQEINNSNSFEISKLSLVKENSFQFINYFLPSNSNQDSPATYKLISGHPKPPVNIPILISTLLI